MIKKLTKGQLQRQKAGEVLTVGPVTVYGPDEHCDAYCDTFCVTEKEYKNGYNDKGAYSSGQTEFREFSV